MRGYWQHTAEAAAVSAAELIPTPGQPRVVNLIYCNVSAILSSLSTARHESTSQPDADGA